MNSIAIFWCGMVAAIMLMIIGAYIYANIIYPAWRDKRGSRLDMRRLEKRERRRR